MKRIVRQRAAGLTALLLALLVLSGCMSFSTNSAFSSHLEIVCLLTPSFPAVSSWESPLSFSSPLLENKCSV